MPIVGDLLADRYRIDGVLGAGGMASVYRATDLRLDRPVAVKVLSANLAADPTVALRFEREARALAAAAHPSVVAVFDVAPGDPETGREPFYVMELCDGGTLGDRLAADGRLDPSDLIPALEAVADGLADLHRRGVIHRDVKPANIVYLGDRPKLADFGLARSDEQDLTTLTAQGMTVGTLAFLAPELLAGTPATPASDVYALGVTAFQGLTGRLPTHASSIGDLIDERGSAAPVVSSVAPELGTRFDRPIARALAVDPAERPAADELARELASVISRGSASKAAVNASTRPFFDAADPFPATAVSVPISTSPGSAGRAREETAAPGETLTQIPVAADVSATPARPVSPARRAPPAGRAPTGRRLAASPRRDARRVIDRAGLLVLAGFVAVVLLLAGLSSILGGGAKPGASPSNPVLVIAASPSAGSPSAAVSSPSPIVSPSSSPVLTPSAGPAARALAAVDNVVNAIEAARGGGGLKGKEANDLERLAADVRARLRAADFDEARDAADRLQERVRKVADELDRARRERLQDAVAALVEAIPEE